MTMTQYITLLYVFNSSLLSTFAPLDNNNLTTCKWYPSDALYKGVIPCQGRRKQFFSGQANQLQSCVCTEFRVMSGHKCKLLCEAH